MRFTAPVSFEEAVWILASHGQVVPVLADTLVELPEMRRRSSGDFVVKRRWKTSVLLKYTVVEIRGSLTQTAEQQTLVNARIQLGDMAYVAVVFAIIMLVAAPNAPEPEVFRLAAGVIVALFAVDAYVIYRIIRSLKKGKRRS